MVLSTSAVPSSPTTNILGTLACLWWTHNGGSSVSSHHVLVLKILIVTTDTARRERDPDGVSHATFAGFLAKLAPLCYASESENQGGLVDCLLMS